MIEYAVQYISTSSLDYHSVWWRLFHAPNSAGQMLTKLLSLPASNGKLERTFSLLGTVKVDKRSRLTNQSLDDLLLLLSNKIPLQNFNPNPSNDLWWSAKRRRLSQKERKQYKSRGADRPSVSFQAQ